MNEKEQFYQERISAFELQRQKTARITGWLTFLRLVIFILIAFAAYWFWPNYKLVAADIFIGGIFFFIAVSYHQKMTQKKRYLSQLIKINQHEIAYLKGDLSYFNTGEQYKNDQHDFCNDLDVFGEESVFQKINRTVLNEGENQLAELLKSNDIDDIPSKQNTVKELAHKIDFRQSFTAEASLVKSEISNQALVDWLKNYKAFSPKIAPYLSIIFSVLSVAFISMLFLGYLGV